MQTTEVGMGRLLAGVHWGVDRMLAVGYGLVYDYIFDRFPPYRRLRQEVMALVSEAAGLRSPREVRVLDLGCGPGNCAIMLAEAGYSVVGIDAYDPLIALAHEKRRVQRLPNLAFRHADILTRPFRADEFDQLVNVHFLYAHADPRAVLREAFRILRPGGTAIFVNLTRRVHTWASLRSIRERFGLAVAVRSMLWVIPNALFESLRRPTGPHYWDERQFAAELAAVGFTLDALRRTFFDSASLLALARKPAGGPPGVSAHRSCPRVTSSPHGAVPDHFLTDSPVNLARSGQKSSGASTALLRKREGNHRFET